MLSARRPRFKTAQLLGPTLFALPFLLAAVFSVYFGLGLLGLTIGGVDAGDARDDGPLLRPEIDRQLHELLRIGHALGGQYFGHAQIDFHELVDRNAIVGWCGRLR